MLFTIASPIRPACRLNPLVVAALVTAGCAMTGAVQAQGVETRLDLVRVEAAGLIDHPDAKALLDARLAASAEGGSGDWTYRLGAQLDAQGQTGDRDFDKVSLDYTENYLRWAGSDTMQVTVGTQKVLWGRVDEVSPIDRLSRADLTRGMLDRLPQRRRAVPAIRGEYFGDGMKLDAVLVPVFDEAVLPEAESIWNPIDTVRGRMLGVGSMPALVGARVEGPADEKVGGGGLRYTAEGDGFDYGFSVQRSRQSMPYYRMSATPSGVVLRETHPWSTVVGAELEAQQWGATWRMEAAWSSDVPLTTAQTFQYRTDPGYDLVVGSEFFPGDAETRVTLQMAMHKTATDHDVVDRTTQYALTGEVEHPFAEGQWQINFRFAQGLKDKDSYLNPQLTYKGIDQHEFYLGAHLFSGDEDTMGGFYRDNDMVTVGWRARF
ncbi:hypothetical protein [Hydrogenophaga sp. 5NK40-0174]|uniref:hypothetical protein n=1 Tax=Hydrogenophaga sp. 5NK40-0174 TaxID=3127649 RepID=UPI003104C2B5